MTPACFRPALRGGRLRARGVPLPSAAAPLQRWLRWAGLAVPPARAVACPDDFPFSLGAVRWEDRGAGYFILASLLLLFIARQETWWRVKIPLCSFRVRILNLALKWVSSFPAGVLTKQFFSYHCFSPKMK